MLSEIRQLQVVYVRDEKDDWQDRSSQPSYYKWDSGMDDDSVRDNHRRGADDQWKQEIMDDLREKQIHQNNDGYAG